MTESEPLPELQIQVLLEEAKARWSEINARISMQNSILHFAVLLGAGAITLVSQLSSRKESPHDFLSAYLGISALFCVLGLLHTLHEQSIAALASYVNGIIRPKIVGIVGSDVLGWEDYWGMWKRNKIYAITTLFRPSFFLIPAAASVLHAKSAALTTQLSGVNLALVWANIVLSVWLVVAWAGAAAKLRSIPRSVESAPDVAVESSVHRGKDDDL